MMWSVDKCSNAAPILSQGTNTMVV